MRRQKICLFLNIISIFFIRSYFYFGIFMSLYTYIVFFPFFLHNQTREEKSFNFISFYYPFYQTTNKFSHFLFTFIFLTFFPLIFCSKTNIALKYTG